jgi:small-conductance mechanosensitive channel
VSPFRPLLEQLALLIGRTVAPGEATASLLARVLLIASVVLIGWIGYRLVTGLIRRLLRPLEGAADQSARAQRARTLEPLLTSTVRYLVAFAVALVILHQLGIDVQAVIVSAGVVGLAVGFGAQSLIKDMIAGVFLLFENLIAVGDVIEVGNHVGVVEAVGLRVTKVRKFSGELRIVPNGDLSAFGNHSASWSRAVVEVGIGYDQDVGRALAALDRAGQAFQAAFPRLVLERPLAQGILRFGASEVVLRLSARVSAQERADLEMALRRKIKDAFDAAEIRIPLPQHVVHLEPDRAFGRAAAGHKEPAA